MSKSKEIEEAARPVVVSDGTFKEKMWAIVIIGVGILYFVKSEYDRGREVSRVILRQRNRDARLQRREQRRYEKRMMKEQRRREFENYLYGAPR